MNEPASRANRPGGAAKRNSAAVPFSPSTEPFSSPSAQEPRPQSDSGGAVTTRTFQTKAVREPYWVLVVAVLATLLIVAVAASFPYVSKSSQQQCKTLSCRELSAVLQRSIDASVEPCDNFYRHVCNRWIAGSPTGRSVFGEITHGIRVTIGHDALATAAAEPAPERPSNASGDPTSSEAKRAAATASTFYTSCVRAPTEANRQLKELRKVYRETGVSWPYLYPVHRWQRAPREDADGSSEGVRVGFEALVNMAVRWGFPLWFDVALNLSKPRTVVLETLPSFSKPPLNEEWTRLNLFRPQFEKLVRAVHKFFTNTEVNHDAIEPFLRSHRYIQRLVREGSTARDTLRFESLRAFSANLTVNVSAQTWADVLSAAFDEPLTADSTSVVVVGAPFLTTVNAILAESSTDSVLLHLGWAFQLSMGRVLSREVAAEINGWGSTEETMADYCFLWTEHLLGFALTAPALRRSLDARTKSAAEAVYALTSRHFRESLQQSSWMDNRTKKQALRRIGDLQLAWTVAQKVPRERLYTSLPEVDPVAFVANWQRLAQFRRKIRSALLAANAHYYPVSDDGMLDAVAGRLTVPVARIQQPLFYGAQEPSMGVALLGPWFARQMAQLLFKASWFASGPEERSVSDAVECFENDFPSDTSFTDAAAAVALLEPTRRAFLASNTSVSGVTSAQLRLPGLGQLQGEQIFFAAHCFTLCGTVAGAESATMSGESLCNVPLMHSEAFSAAFNCPRGSLMNPEHKCSFW